MVDLLRKSSLNGDLKHFIWQSNKQIENFQLPSLFADPTWRAMI